MPLDTGGVNQILTGDKLSGTDLATWYNALNALTGAWTDYSTAIISGGAWTGASGNPAAGNATIASSYTQIGKLVHWQGSIFMGSTTTFGSGVWTIAWPVTPVSTAVTSALLTGSAFIRDNSATTSFGAASCVSNGTAGINFYSASGGAVSNLIPMTWAASDRLGWNITYPAA